ncbi:MAG: hypothetical protein U0L20_03485 [Ruminococcus sp.]|nr:hypothetical protein [Ruminococcus sp.]
MNKLKNYTFRFYFLGLIVFMLVMLPNIIWFAVPADNDILREASKTELLDTVASVFQMLTAVGLCTFVNITASKLSVKNPTIILSIISLVSYYALWILYYSCIRNPFVFIGLCLFPCLTFIFFELDRKNYIALILTVVFTVLHLLFGVINFVL